MIEPIAALTLVAVIAVTLPGTIRAYVRHIDRRERTLSEREAIYLIPPGGLWERKLGVPTSVAAMPRSSGSPASLFVDFHPLGSESIGESRLYVIDGGQVFSAQTRGYWYGWENDVADRIRVSGSGDQLDERLRAGYSPRPGDADRWQATLATGSYDVRITVESSSASQLESLAAIGGAPVLHWIPTAATGHFVGVTRTDSYDGSIAIDWSTIPGVCVKHLEIERARVRALSIVVASDRELQVVATPSGAGAAP